VIIALAVALGTLAQSVSGIGFGLVCSPVFVTVLGQDEGVRLCLFLSAFVNLAVLARHHRGVDLRELLLLLVPAAVATPLLASPLHDVPDRLAKVIAGAGAVLGAAALGHGLRARRLEGPAGAVAAAVLSAAMNDAAGIGGPAVALHADNARWTPSQMRSTLQAYFLGLNVVALASLGLPSLSGGRVGSVGLAVLVGLGTGHLIAHRVSAETARRTTLLLAGTGGAAVVLLALAG